MKSYYYFIRNPHHFTKDDVVFHVAVGRSDRECVQLSLLKQYCKDCGHYFKIVSDTSDQAVDLMLSALIPGSIFPRLHIKSQVISISKLYGLIIDGTLENYEHRLTMPKGRFHLLSTIDTLFFFKNSKEGKKGLPSPLIRKNLSNCGDSQSSYVAIAAFAIIVLFLLAGHLEYIENSLYF